MSKQFFSVNFVEEKWKVCVMFVEEKCNNCVEIV